MNGQGKETSISQAEDNEHIHDHYSALINALIRQANAWRVGAFSLRTHFLPRFNLDKSLFFIYNQTNNIFVRHTELFQLSNVYNSETPE